MSCLVAIGGRPPDSAVLRVPRGVKMACGQGKREGVVGRVESRPGSGRSGRWGARRHAGAGDVRAGGVSAARMVAVNAARMVAVAHLIAAWRHEDGGEVRDRIVRLAAARVACLHVEQILHPPALRLVVAAARGRRRSNVEVIQVIQILHPPFLCRRALGTAGLVGGGGGGDLLDGGRIDQEEEVLLPLLCLGVVGSQRGVEDRFGLRTKGRGWGKEAGVGQGVGAQSGPGMGRSRELGEIQAGEGGAEGTAAARAPACRSRRPPGRRPSGRSRRRSGPSCVPCVSRRRARSRATRARGGCAARPS